MEPRRLAIDTDVLVDFLRRGEAIVPLALRHFDCAVTAVIVYELHAVVSPARQQAALDQVLRRVNVHVLDMATSQRAAEIWRALTAAGQVIGVLDILSAAICLHHDLPMLTRNVEHFRRVPGLRVITPR